ncbi:MAG: hypothetical protein KIT48_07295 [Pseudolabrys sp.]|jgi:hypothetical protein|nr:hypothetical protein [Pseudolabrys sp.]
MAKASIIAALAAVALTAAPALADIYPISGSWGVSASTEKGPIDCARLRVISFSGNQRTDSNSGVPAYRNKSVQRGGASEYRVVDVFTTGQISNAQARYTLKLIDADRVEMDQQPGGRVTLRKCK